MNRACYWKSAALVWLLCGVVAAPQRIEAQNDNLLGEIAYVLLTPDSIDPAGEIHLITLDDGLSHRLTDSPAHDSSPAWSPDGERLLFTSDRGGDNLIYVMDADGDNVQALVPGSDPAWSPDGAQIVYARMISQPGEQGRRYAIYLMNADSTHQRRISSDQFVTAFDPAWSPEGQQIVFAARRGEDGGSDLCRFDVITGNLEPLTTTPDIIERDPAFSPDGEWIAFSGDDGAAVALYRVRRDGSELVPLTLLDNGIRQLAPAWSADGKGIAFCAQNAFGDQPDTLDGLYLMDLDNGDTHLLVENGCYPAWRPYSGED
jgi:TolB protein